MRRNKTKGRERDRKGWREMDKRPLMESSGERWKNGGDEKMERNGNDWRG